MKILLTIEDISFGRGAERVTINLANALAERGYKVSILSFYQRYPDLPYTAINPSVQLIFRYNYEQSIAQENAKKQFLKGLYYKNIHKILLSYELRKADYDYIISSCFAYFPYFKNKTTKYIKYIHLNFHRYQSRNRYFDTLVVLSNKELDIWQHYHKNVCVIPNFLPQIPKQSTDYTRKVVLSVGRMDDNQKGFLRLLDIWKIVQDKIVDCHDFATVKSRNDRMTNDLHEWKLIIVGDGILKDEIEAKIQALSLQESVILKPFTKEIGKEYLSASIYAMSSYFEGFPMVLLESTSYGLAPISFDIKTGPSDIIKNDQSGFLITDNDLQDYAHKLILLMSDEKLRTTFGKKAKELVSERFGKEAVIGLWQELFEKDKVCI